MSTTKHRTISHAEWLAEGKALFPGLDHRDWRFVCPVCGHPQSARDIQALGIGKDDAESYAGFSCIGRWVPGARDAFKDGGVGPCTYAGGGLFRLNPVTVVAEDGHKQTYFEWDRGGAR